MLYDHADQEDADDHVIDVKVNVSENEYGVIAGYEKSVTICNDRINNTVDHGGDQHVEQKAALFFTARNAPSSRNKDEQQNCYAEAIADKNSI